MLDIFPNTFQISMIIMFQSYIVSWCILKLLCLSNQNFLSYLYISSGKSTTNARLLGGLSISAALLTSLTTIVFFQSKLITQLESKLFMSAMLSIFLVTVYGYIDDKFEVRVRFKLALQLLSIFSFAYISAPALSSEHTAIAFIFSSVIGLALVNGTNLLDGLDTLSVKMGLGTSAAFLYLGILAKSPATIFLSLIMASALCMFYFFNRAPARVYLGEIGGGVIGLVYYIQSTLCYSNLKLELGAVQALSMVLIAGSFPISELGISFLRRMWFKKSPFRGDRLHLHYIIKLKYGFDASKTSTRMGIAGLLITSFGYIVASSYLPIIGLITVVGLTIQSYLWICVDEWKATYISENTSNVFKIFEGKTINIIDSSQFNSLDIVVKEEGKSKKSA